MTTYVKIVKGATKIKVAAPKPKYIEPILIATADNGEFKTVMTALYDRLGDSAWSVVFKSLLVLHIMIREGEKDITLRYLAKHQEFFALPQMKQSRNEAKSLLRYAKYIGVKSKQFQSTKIDYVRDEQVNGSKKTTRLRNLSIEKGLLREVESIEIQIEALLRCKFTEAEINNDIVLTCFRMLVNDLLNLFQALNEGVINILEHYFEMSKYDAERALDIYKDFVVLTTDVVNYLRVAKHLEYATKLHVPTIRHAPTALAKSLEEYLNDSNFESNRTQYLAEQDFKSTPSRSIEPTPKEQQPAQSIQPLQSTSISNPWANQIQVQFTQAQVQPQLIQQQAPQAQPVSTFQQNVQQGQQVQQTPQVFPQSTGNPFLQQQQPQPQQLQLLPQSQPQPLQLQLQPLQSFKTGSYSSVPTSALAPTFTGAGFGNGISQQFTGSNPFVPSLPLQHQQPQVTKPLESSKTGNNPFALNYRSSLNPIQEASANPFSVQNTGATNPFAASTSAATTAPLNVQSTGTNPFQRNYTSNRISINQPTFGGFEQLPTTPVFPQTIQEQRTLQFNQQANFELQQQINQNRMPFNNQQGFQQQQQQQPQQQQQQHYGGAYNGPSLI